MSDRPERSATAILLVLFFGVLMGALDIAIVGPALPALRAHFGVDERAVAWVFTIYVLFNLLGTPIMAKLSDRLGRRLVYTADVALFALGSAIAAGAGSFTQLLVGRAIQAFGAGGIFPVASAVIGDTLPVERRGRALGLIGAVFGIAFLVGPFVAAGLLRFGWAWLFLINLPIAALLMIASWRLLPSRRAPEPAPFDWAGAVLLSGALAAIALGLSAIDSRAIGASLASRAVWPLLLAGAVLLWRLVGVERAAADPVLRPSWFAARPVKLVALFAAGAGLGEAAMVFLPDLAVSALGMTPHDASLMLLPVVLALAIGSPGLGRLLDRVGPRPIILTALVTLALGGVVLALLPITRGTLITAGALVGFGISGLLGAPLRYVILDAVAAGERASAQGILTVFISIGQLLCGVLIGAVAASAGGGAEGYREAFGVIAALCAAMAVASLALPPRRTAVA
ncbi:MAG: MFS transporter [Steroidobacteraceae bacterium]